MRDVREELRLQLVGPGQLLVRGLQLRCPLRDLLLEGLVCTAQLASHQVEGLGQRPKFLRGEPFTHRDRPYEVALRDASGCSCQLDERSADPGGRQKTENQRQHDGDKQPFERADDQRRQLGTKVSDGLRDPDLPTNDRDAGKSGDSGNVSVRVRVPHHTGLLTKRLLEDPGGGQVFGL